MSIRNILTICRKDLMDAVQNRNILLLVLMPILIAIALSYLVSAAWG